MHETSRATIPLTLQTQASPTLATSSFGSTICDDSHYLTTLPSAVSDFPASSDLSLWRDAKYESSLGDSFPMMSDCCNKDISALQSPDSMPNIASSYHEQSLWTPSAGTSSFQPTQYQHSPGGVPENSPLLDPNDRQSNSASLGTSAVSGNGHMDNKYSTRSPSLAVKVNTSDYDLVQPEQWSYAVTDYDHDDASSPSSTDTHSSGPRTPADYQPNASFFHMQNNNGYGGASFEQAQPKMATSFGFMSSTTSLPHPPIGHAQPMSTAASFGNLTFASATSSHSGPWPMSAAYTSGLYHPTAHGMQIGGPGLLTNYPYETYQDIQPPPVQPAAVQPAAVQPVHYPGFGTVQDFADSGMDASTEACSEDDSDSDMDDRLGEDMNDRALHDAQVRRDRDKYLLKMRHEGFSYKEIKRRGNFREAESTLRGRVRVLTKDKADRVRRPEWTEEDVSH